MKEFDVIYKILKYLRSAMDYDEIDADFISAEALGISQNKQTAIMAMLASEGYISGVSVKQGAQGDIIISSSRPRITLKGLEYLEENSLMKKAARLAKGIKEIVPGM